MKINQRQFIVTLTVTENNHRSITLQSMEDNETYHTYIPSSHDVCEFVPFLEGVLVGMPKPEAPV